MQLKVTLELIEFPKLVHQADLVADKKCCDAAWVICTLEKWVTANTKIHRRQRTQLSFPVTCTHVLSFRYFLCPHCQWQSNAVIFTPHNNVFVTFRNSLSDKVRIVFKTWSGVLIMTSPETPGCQRGRWPDCIIYLALSSQPLKPYKSPSSWIFPRAYLWVLFGCFVSILDHLSSERGTITVANWLSTIENLAITMTLSMILLSHRVDGKIKLLIQATNHRIKHSSLS